MKVFIAGASGVLGRRLTRRFVERGHSVIGLARTPKGENVIRRMGGEPRFADLFDADSLAKAAEDCDTVIHAATSIPIKRNVTPSDWAMNDRIRRHGTRSLTEATAKIGARTYLQQSVVWVACPPDGHAFDEDSPLVSEPVMQSAIDAEAIARDAGSADGFVTAILRGGAFYDYESGHTRMLADGIRNRSIPIIGTGEVIWSMIHTDDAASAYVAVAEKPQNGIWHVVDDEPVAVRDFLRGLANRLGALPPRQYPKWLARWFAGGQALSQFTRSTVTSNARLRQNFGWTPQYPSYREGLDQIVAAWNSETGPKRCGAAEKAR